ncbi:N-acetyltransferase [Patescibacteria group bacterium]|nr:MAG: N-acetyltransferase [Patescibacteria group bacterium]
MTKPKNIARDLHQIPALQKVQVQDDVYLRLVQESDAKRTIEILEADPSIRDRVTVASKMLNEADVVNEIRRGQSKPDILRYTLVQQDNMVGWVNLWQDNGYMSGTPNPTVIGFGYFLDPSMRGRGLVTASIQALMQMAQTSMEITEFVAFCEDSNAPSVKILKKLGFNSTDDTFEEPRNGWVERMWVRPAQ